MSLKNKQIEMISSSTVFDDSNDFSLISQEVRSAVLMAQETGLSYALYIYPDDDKPHFIAAFNPIGSTSSLTPDEFEGFEGFVFNMFEISDRLHAYGIRPQLSVDDVLSISPELIPPQRDCRAIFSNKTTDRMVYNAQVRRIIRSLDSDNEKTVLSRVVNISNSESNPISVATKYFKVHPGCFRFLFYTPESGTWLGASPELLIDINRRSGELRSMSLAGTRNNSEAGEWDEKNRLEHDMVTNFIIDVLNRYCSHVDMPCRKTVSFGDIQHLCHTISARGDFRLSQLLPELSPTPALCGYPRQQAYEQIIQTETHRRLCYGGFVGNIDRKRARLFVNLRSAMVEKASTGKSNHGEENSYNYNLYAGGGITCHSIPEKEEIETINKLSSLNRIIEITQKF